MLEVEQSGVATFDDESEWAESELLLDDVSQFPRFEYSNSDVKRAGKVIASDMPWTDESAPGIRKAFHIANSWRDSHALPMRCLRASVIHYLRACGIQGLTAARLKRMQAIRRKLRRIELNLNQLQDLGGCRAILSTIDDVHALVGTLRGKIRHELWAEDDYIAQPKADGYRSHHLRFKFVGRNHQHVYDGRRIELQVRTRLQHSWATAVEAVGLFRGEELKNHQGSFEWLRLFLLMAGEFAETEACALPPGCPQKSIRRQEIKELEKALGAVNVLESVSHGVRGTDLPLISGYRPKYYLIRYDHATRTVHVEPQDRPLNAAASYDQAEDADNKSGVPTQNVVLVEVDKIENLKAAYPNYFGDVEMFKSTLRNITLGLDARQYSVTPRQPAPRRQPPNAISPSWLTSPRFPKPSLKKKRKGR